MLGVVQRLALEIAFFLSVFGFERNGDMNMKCKE